MKRNQMLEEYTQCNCVYYLESVLDVVTRLPDVYCLQHTCVTQLPQHQVIVKP